MSQPGSVDVPSARYPEVAKNSPLVKGGGGAATAVAAPPGGCVANWESVTSARYISKGSTIFTCLPIWLDNPRALQALPPFLRGTFW